MENYNFMPAVKCPHCGHVNHPEISGWGGQFNTRTKGCRKCGKDYTLVVYAQATTEPDISMEVSSLENRIEDLRKKIYLRRQGLIERSELLARELITIEASLAGNQN